ncbi:MAG: heavy-metal-associated domain-containing protein [Lewinella sp.]|nr:heavy-metal-associated domain-containing protein [Lewinella sp.]
MNKLKFFFTAALLLAFTASAYSQACHESKSEAAPESSVQALNPDANLETTTFRVSGNCGMCKRTIEGAATSVTGVQSANWDQDAKVITVSFDPETTTLLSIKEKIAQSGYDTEGVRATDEAYLALHGCCQYERVKL